jgi:hypothetical protein
MKVFVCYWDYDSDEGCSSPEAVFLTEAEAVEYCKDDPAHHAYSEFEVEAT